jgi:hypothetical protein
MTMTRAPGVPVAELGSGSATRRRKAPGGSGAGYRGAYD